MNGQDLINSKGDVIYVLDSTKINDFIRCPRLFFYSHVLGWKVNEPNLHLKFGESLHVGFEQLYRDGFPNYTFENLLKAQEMFTSKYFEYFDEATDAANFPKNAGNGVVALTEYCAHYKDDDFKVHHVEVAGSVTINPDFDRSLHFKVDTIIETPQGVAFMDHKTCGKLGASWDNQWPLSFQMQAYSHLLYCIYGTDFYAAIINGICLKKQNEFRRLTIQMNYGKMRQWLMAANYYYEEIERQLQKLEHSRDSDEVLEAFPPSFDCVKYGLCPFHRFCATERFNNPLSECETTPAGFKVEMWDPRSAEETAGEVMHI